MDKEALDKIENARFAIMMNTDLAFFSTLLGQTEFVENSSYESMATDGEHIYYNPTFTLSLTRDELIYVLCHEIGHDFREHGLRRNGRDPDMWNKACDHEINLEQNRLKVGKMPKKGLADPRFTGHAAEEIYHILMAEKQAEQGNGGKQGNKPDDAGQGGQPKPGDKPGDGGGEPGKAPGGGDPGGCGQVLDTVAPGDKAAAEEAHAKMQSKIRQAAAIAAKACGEKGLPEGIKEMIDRICRPAVDYESIFHRFIDNNVNTRESWSRLNMRMLANGFLLPGREPDGISHLVFAVDTSASMDKKALETAAGWVITAFESGRIDTLTVIYADTTVRRVDQFDAGDAVHIDATGRGGTRFSDTMNWIKRNVSGATFAVYFTDLEVNDFGEDPGIPLMWAVYGKRNDFQKLADRVPFGEAIYIETHN